MTQFSEHSLPDGRFSAITDGDCHILAPDMRVLCRLPGKEIENKLPLNLPVYLRLPG